MEGSEPDKGTMWLMSYHSFCSLFWDAGSILGSKPCPSGGVQTPVTPVRHPWVAFAMGPRLEEAGEWNSILACFSGVGSDL